MKYVPNKAGEKIIARSPRMLVMLKGRASAGAAVAKQIAPRQTGAYADGIVAEAGIDDGMAKGRINAKDFKSNWIEFGTGAPGPTPAYAVLRRACDAVGLSLVGGDK